MIRKSGVILSLVASLCLGTVLTTVALGQTTAQPKLMVSNISLGSAGDEYYSASVNLVLQRSSNARVDFSVSFEHVKSLDEIYAKLRPAVDDLADELKHAEIVIPH